MIICIHSRDFVFVNSSQFTLQKVEIRGRNCLANNVITTLFS